MKLPKLSFSLRRVDWRSVPQWFVAAALGWKEYIIKMPERARALTRYEFRLRSARLLFAVVITYAITGVAVGLGYYIPVKWCNEGVFKKVKVCPARLDNSFAQLLIFCNYW